MRFAVGLGASLLLHAALVLPWLSEDRPAERLPKRELLVVDLLGMVSNRQEEQKQAAAQQVVQPERAPAAAPRKPALKPEIRVHPPVPRPTTLGPVHVARAAEAPVHAVPEPSVPVPAAPSVAGAADEQRLQQTLRARAIDQDVLRRYLAGLRMAIQRKLLYPAEAREAGLIGTPMIRFTLTEEGNILAGSLVVQRSSGYPVLDDSAMRAAMAGAPFERPPRQMDVAIAVGFAQEQRERP